MKVTSILFMSAILFSSAIVASATMMQDADALKSAGNSVRITGSLAVCGEVLCSEFEGGRAAYEAQEKINYKGNTRKQVASTGSDLLQNQYEAIIEKMNSGERLSKGDIQVAKRALEEQRAEEVGANYYGDAELEKEAGGIASTMQNSFGQTASDTVTSVLENPTPGHEGHQIVVLLPPSEKIYVGKLTFSASENVQYVTLTGPLADGEDMGQPTWSPDGGKTVFAITTVDNGQKTGGWFFAGNALALHTMNDTPFTTTYSLAYSHVVPGEYPKGTVATGTITSIPDPGQGHENHSIALILPPRDIPYQGGVISYSASENVQLVALIGPLDEGDAKGQATWTSDGETYYALSIVDGGKMGIWNTFSGNALALHTMNPDGFTATYTLAGLH
jgi:hypothetical protein